MAVRKLRYFSLIGRTCRRTTCDVVTVEHSQILRSRRHLAASVEESGRTVLTSHHHRDTILSMLEYRYIQVSYPLKLDQIFHSDLVAVLFRVMVLAAHGARRHRP
jgi:hypothetical protein